MFLTLGQVVHPLNHGVTMEREKQKALKTQCFQGFLMSMGYKKDIFAVFAYEFELSHKK